MALSGTTNGHLATQGFKTLEKRTGQLMHDLAAEHEGKQITFADTQAAPVPVITSPEWSGSESGGRRYSPFTINVERLKPWHTLTGRQHFYLDHDWMQELGEGLPVYRPPLNMTQLFGEPAIGDPERARRLGALPDPAQQVVDPPRVPGQPVHALPRPRRPGDLDLRQGRRQGRDQGQRLGRGGQPQRRGQRPSHRQPPDARGHRVHAPRPGPADRRAPTEKTGKRGGIHNSLTRILVKPSHIIGGYAQLSFAFNYLGPTGNQRDEVTVIRRRSQEVQY